MTTRDSRTDLEINIQVAAKFGLVARPVPDEVGGSTVLVDIMTQVPIMGVWDTHIGWDYRPEQLNYVHDPAKAMFLLQSMNGSLIWLAQEKSWRASVEGGKIVHVDPNPYRAIALVFLDR